MAYIVEKTGNLKTVGDVIRKLQEFPEDMPVRVGLG